MFEPDNKRTTGRSLLDFAPQASPDKARLGAASERRVQPGSLIEQLNLLSQDAPPASDKARNLRAAAPGNSVADEHANRRTARPAPDHMTPVSALPATDTMPRAEISDANRPVIDLAIVAGSVWQLRKIILATTVLGAIGGVMFALSTPNTYVAESKLYIDPREVRLTDSDLSKESLSTEAILAIVDSQMQVLHSPGVLSKVANDLDLERDAEFGKAPRQGGGFLDGVQVMRQILSPDVRQATSSAADATVDPQVLDNLSEAVSVFRDPKTFIVTVEVKSRDAEKSALIANRLVTTFLDEEQTAQSNFFQRTTEALDSRLAELRRSLDEAENAVEKYKADHDIIGANGELIADKQLLALNDQVAVVRSRISDARAKADVAGRADADLLLNGGLPEEITSVTMPELRKQYSTARAQLGSLETSLGPRHPQRLAAAQAVEVARVEVNNELRRIAASNRTELERAQKAEQDLLRQLAVQKSQQVNASGSFIELRELERKAAATRTIYETFLKRAGETGEEEKLTSKNIRVISPAQAPLTSSGTSRKIIAGLGVMLGLMAGIGMGVLLGVVRSLRLVLSSSKTSSVAVIEETSSPPDGDGDGPGKREKMLKTASEPSYDRNVSRHHVEASALALSALAERRPDVTGYDRFAPANTTFDPAIAHVQDELRALRSRVEDYARHKKAYRR